MFLFIALPLVPLVGLSLVNGRAVENLQLTNQKVTRLRDSQQLSAHLLKELVDNETGQRGFILAQDPAFLEPYEASLRELPRLQHDLATSLTATEGQAIFQDLRRAAEERLGFSAKTVGWQRAGDHEGSVALVKSGEGRRLMDQVRAQFQRLDAHLGESIERAEAQYAAGLRLNQKVSWAMVGAQCLLLGLLVLLLFRLRRTEHFVHICAWSRTIEYEGEWISFEEYLERKFQFSISHGISPEEAAKLRGFGRQVVE